MEARVFAFGRKPKFNIMPYWVSNGKNIYMANKRPINEDAIFPKKEDDRELFPKKADDGELRPQKSTN